VKLITLKLTGYRQFLEPTVLHFPDGLSGICGPNGVGKSKLIEAIGYALYGAAAPVLPKGDKVSDLPSRACPTGQAAARVELLLDVRGQRYEIIRARRESTIRLQGATESLAVGAKAVTTKVIELLHLSPAAYYGTFVAQQKEVAGLQTLSSEDRKRLINRLIGIEQVEHALKLADDERKARTYRLEIVRESQWKPSRVAIAERDALQLRQDTARVEEELCSAATTGAQREYDEAFSAVADIQRQIEVLEGLQHALDTIQANRTSLETAYFNAQKRLSHATEATRELHAAQAVVTQTAKAQELLEQWDRLAAIDVLRTQQASLERDLTERLSPLLAARETLKRVLNEDNAALEELRAEQDAYQQQRVRIEQRGLQAKEGADRLEQRMATIRLLGPDGACETCGQTFGDTLETALAHYAKERDAARQEEAQAAQQTTELLEKEAALALHMNERVQVRAEHSERLLAYDEVPGEIRSAQRNLENLAAQLALSAPDEFAQVYDAATHATVRAEIDQRSQAEAAIARLQPIAETEVEARKEARDLENQLRAMDQKLQQIEAELKKGVPLTDALARAREGLVATTKTRDEANEKARQAFQHLTQISTQLEAAELELVQAHVQEQRVAEAEAALLVAERTKELLAQLLLEITAEARPRLAELLDSWARALLGQRFRQVELTDDYRILADNGSGLHQITHFSGGEQTLLAVMLRVAIALFCRERAGFDTSFLILDEVFGDQDGEHREQLVQFLGEVKEHYHQILVINHVDDVTEMLDSIIDVKRTDLNTSIAELRS
jgi:DNA repair protein SbcC/Rad50